MLTSNLQISVAKVITMRITGKPFLKTILEERIVL